MRETQTGASPTPNPQRPLEVLHFGDLHLWRFRLEREFSFKRLLGLANLSMRRARQFPSRIGYALIDQLARAKADWLLFSGDLTTTGLEREFEYGRMAFEPVFEAWGERFVAIPGNHDRYTVLAVLQKRFERIFMEQDEFPRSVRLNESWTLVNFDCSVPRLIRAAGKLGESAQDEIMKDIEAAETPHVLLMGHYPLIYEVRARVRQSHALPSKERESMLAKLNGSKVRAYLHGHQHRRWMIERDGIVHLNCGSAGMIGTQSVRQPGYLRLKLSNDGLVEAQMHTYYAGDDCWKTEPLRPAVAGMSKPL